MDQDGLPVRLHLTPGQASDKTTAPILLDALPPGTVVADRGHDSLALVERVAPRGGQAHIPTQSRVRIQRSVPPDIYRRRNLIDLRRENGPPDRFLTLLIFCKLKQFRRIATRFEKHATSFLAAVALASARIWLRSIESAL